MCGSCGCADGEGATILDLQTGQRMVLHRHESGGAGHHHDHDHDHDHHHGDGDHHHHDDNHKHHAPAATQVDLEKRILARNDEQAALNRAFFSGREVLALNLVSSPGAGKTTLLERTIRDLGAEFPISVIEGDQATANDAERIRKTGAPAIQVNTGAGCHLEADMIDKAVRALKPAAGSLLLIENVGNLVCPALFDLGERAKVAIFSVTEGEDKPLKYPHMFAAANVLLISKMDLLPHLEFDITQAVANARQVNAKVEIFQLSARNGDGLNAWYDWLRREMGEVRQAAFR